MNRFWCMIVPVFMVGSSLVEAQNVERIDSLLAARDYAGAREAINAAPAGSVEDARTVIDHLQSLPNLPDSLFTARVLNAMTQADEYEAGNAGKLSASFYMKMQGLHASQKSPAAYECLVLARYFRTKHVREELDRLRNNLATTYGYVATEDFTKADALCGMFSQEQRTYAFRIIEDSLHRAYEWLRPQIEDGKVRQRRERSRTTVSRNWYVMGGAGMNPSVRLDKQQLTMTEIEPREYAVWDVPRISIKTIALFWCLEGGYFVSPRTSLGLSFARWRDTYRNPVKNLWKGEYFSYSVAVEYMRGDVFVKYRLTDKTGPRPLLAAGLGFARYALSSLEEPDAGHNLQVTGSESTVYRLMIGGGAEYVFSENSPLFAACNASVYLNSEQTGILSRFTFEVTLQAGVIL